MYILFHYQYHICYLNTGIICYIVSFVVFGHVIFIGVSTPCDWWVVVFRRRRGHDWTWAHTYNIHISSCVHHIGYITYPSSPALQADAWRLSLRRTCRPVRWNSMRPWGVIHGDPQWRFSTENCNSNWSHNEHRGLGHNIQDLIFLHSWLVHRFG